MDSSSDSGREGGQRSGGGNRRNRRGGSGQNRNRNRNRNNNSGGGGGGNRRKNSRSDDDSYRPGSGSGGGGGSSRKKQEPPKKKGLFQKIVGFFTGDDGSASNKGTGRPIQTPRKRPGDSDTSQSSNSSRGGSGGGGNRSDSSRPPREGGDRPKRKRSRRGGGGGGGGRGRDGGSRESGGGGRGPRRDRDRKGDRGAPQESRSGDDRQPRAKREPRIVEVTSGRLYVGNLVYEVTEEDLNDLFKGFGNVVSAEIVTNQRNQQSKGFAFVEMGGVEEAKRAVEILHDKDFMGRKLVVTGAKSDGPVESRPDNAANEAAATPEASGEQPSVDETEAASEKAEDTAAEADQALSEDSDEKPVE